MPRNRELSDIQANARADNTLWREVLSFAIVALFSVAGCFLLASPPNAAEPQRSVQRGSIQVGGIQRTFVFHVPASLPEHAPLVIAFHGSGETGEEFRWRTGAAFDRLADANGFIVVYPDGYQRHWDDCRKAASYSARARHIDDVAFVHALIAYFETALDIDPTRIFAVGHSNGGQMSFRLALELPVEIRAIAAISANLPTAENMDCRPTGKPISVLVMNGTADLINPYKGGKVSIFGFGNRGMVLSSEDTARYFATLDGISTLPATERASGPDASSWLERSTWGAPDGLEVVLDTVRGGGHGIPQGRETSGPLGTPGKAFDGPTEIWRFFAGLAR